MLASPTQDEARLRAGPLTLDIANDIESGHHFTIRLQGYSHVRNDQGEIVEVSSGELTENDMRSVEDSSECGDDYDEESYRNSSFEWTLGLDEDGLSRNSSFEWTLGLDTTFDVGDYTDSDGKLYTTTIATKLER